MRKIGPSLAAGYSLMRGAALVAVLAITARAESASLATLAVAAGTGSLCLGLFLLQYAVTHESALVQPMRAVSVLHVVGSILLVAAAISAIGGDQALIFPGRSLAGVGLSAALLVGDAATAVFLLSLPAGRPAAERGGDHDPPAGGIMIENLED